MNKWFSCILFCIGFSLLGAVEDEPRIKDICDPRKQREIIEDLLKSAPDPDKLSKAAEYILYVRSVFEKKGFPVSSIESFCDQFNEKHKDSEIARELTKEILKKKDMNPECFFLQIRDRQVPEIENDTFEQAVDEIVTGLGELVISVFAFFCEQYSTAAGFAGDGARNLKNGYYDLKQAATEEEKKREEAKRRQEEEARRAREDAARRRRYSI